MTDKEQEKLLENILESAAFGIMVVDKAGHILLANGAAERLFGYARAELLDRGISLLVPESRRRAHADNCAEYLSHPTRRPMRPGHGDAKGRRKDGSEFPLEITLAPTETGRGPAALVIVRDITERKEAKEKIEHMAYHDYLTDLPNRRLFNDRLAQALAFAQRTGKILAVLYLDLDRFKQVNDRFGHRIGDLVLQGVAERLTRLLRRTDTVARVGGDEFNIILTGIEKPRDVKRLAEKLIEGLSRSFIIRDREIKLSAGIGISLYPQDGVAAERLISRADAALLSAKDKGPKNFAFHADRGQTGTTSRLRLESELEQAFERDQFVLHYQPVVDLKTGRIIAAEALIRWRHRGRLVFPADFIPLAEETGLIHKIGEWTLKTACRQAKTWPGTGFRSVALQVNVSAVQFQAPDLAEQVIGALRETDFDPGRLQLELTETAVMRNVENAVFTLDRLRKIGVQVLIDDFGIGYSSLAHLKRFKIDSVKIDKSFVENATAVPEDAAIVRIIILIAHSLNFRAIAEGVETSEQLALVRRLGCDAMQGHLFDPALPADEFTRLLAEDRRLAA